jgi:hypothetical protein
MRNQAGIQFGVASRIERQLSGDVQRPDDVRRFDVIRDDMPGPEPGPWRPCPGATRPPSHVAAADHGPVFADRTSQGSIRSLGGQGRHRLQTRIDAQQEYPIFAVS